MSDGRVRSNARGLREFERAFGRWIGLADLRQDVVPVLRRAGATGEADALQNLVKFYRGQGDSVLAEINGLSKRYNIEARELIDLLDPRLRDPSWVFFAQAGRSLRDIGHFTGEMDARLELIRSTEGLGSEWLATGRTFEAVGAYQDALRSYDGVILQLEARRARGPLFIAEVERTSGVLRDGGQAIGQSRARVREQLDLLADQFPLMPAEQARGILRTARKAIPEFLREGGVAERARALMERFPEMREGRAIPTRDLSEAFAILEVGTDIPRGTLADLTNRQVASILDRIAAGERITLPVTVPAPLDPRRARLRQFGR